MFHSQYHSGSVKTHRVTHLLSVLFTFAIALSGISCIDSVESDDHTHSEKGYYLSTALWSSLDIPVCWENPQDVKASDRQLVIDAVNESWASAAPFNFFGWKKCKGDSQGIRILAADGHPHVKGLGTLASGVQDGMLLNFTYESWGTGSRCAQSEEGRVQCIKWIAIHEFGHALGIAHEQNRPDNPETCDAPQGTNGDVTIGDWDQESTMNYCNPVWVNHGQLSAGDIETVNAAYRRLISGGGQGKPSTPGFKLQRRGQNKVLLRWKPKGTKHTEFEIQRSKKGHRGKWSRPVRIAEVNGGVKRHVDQPGKGKFRYRIRSKNPDDASKWSKWKKFSN